MPSSISPKKLLESVVVRMGNIDSLLNHGNFSFGRSLVLRAGGMFVRLEIHLEGLCDHRGYDHRGHMKNRTIASDIERWR